MSAAPGEIVVTIEGICTVVAMIVSVLAFSRDRRKDALSDGATAAVVAEMKRQHDLMAEKLERHLIDCSGAQARMETRQEAMGAELSQATAEIALTHRMVGNLADMLNRERNARGVMTLPPGG